MCHNAHVEVREQPPVVSSLPQAFVLWGLNLDLDLVNGKCLGAIL